MKNAQKLEKKGWQFLSIKNVDIVLQQKTYYNVWGYVTK